MRYLIIIYSLFYLACNSNPQETRVETDNKNQKQCLEYPDLVSSLQIKELYDSAKWFIYTWHCDIPYMPKLYSSQKRTFGELALIFKSVIVRNDTVDIYFNFVDHGKAVLPGSTVNNQELSTGVRFDYKSRKKLAMLSLGGYSIKVHGGSNRYENPLQPDVLKYMKENWDKLDECFRVLGERNAAIK